MSKGELISSMATELLTVSQKGLNPLALQLASILSMPVLLTDSHYYPVASATEDGGEACDEILAVERHDMDEDEAIFMCRIITLDAEEIGWGSPVKQDGLTLGYWFIFDSKNELSVAQARSILGFTSPLAALHLQKQLEFKSEKQKFKEPFIYDLLYGNKKSCLDIIEYGKVWGWDFSLPQGTILFSLMDFKPLPADMKIISNLLYIVDRTLFEWSVKPIAIANDNQVIVILSIDEQNGIGADFVSEFTGLVLKHIEAKYPTRQFAVGIGKVYPKPTDIFRSFKEAKVALELGQMLGIRQPLFARLGLEQILYKHDLEDLKEYYHTTLGPLINNEEAHENGLLETLEAYCLNQFDITATSKTLFLHRNTLRYRLKKIEEILGVSFDDLHIKLDIMAAFKIKQLRKL